MRIIIIAVFMLTCAGVRAQDSEDDPSNRFQFYTNCASVYLVVEYSEEDAARLRLTESMIATTTRSRLRAARIYTDSRPDPILSVTVNVMETVFTISFAFIRFLYNPVTDTSGGAITWVDGSFGTHGYDAGYILQSVDQITARFIDQYLAVNESACE